MTKRLIKKLNTFHSTTSYTEYNSNILLSAGATFLLKETKINWLIEIIYSAFIKINQKADGFAVIRLRVNNIEEKANTHSADLFIDNGNIEEYWDELEPGTRIKCKSDNCLQTELIHKQHLTTTDFPLDEITLYFQYRDTIKDYPRWVLMLASEY